MSHLKAYRFLSAACQIEEDKAKRAKLTRALRLLELQLPSITRETENVERNLPETVAE